MGSFAEGLYTVETKDVSQFGAQGRVNEELLKIKSFDRMYFTNYGPFNLGDSNWEIRVFPVGEFVWYYLCLLDDAVVVKKYGYMSLVQDHSSESDWKIDTAIKLKEEKDFKPTPLGEGLGLPMVPLTYFTKEDQEMYTQDDCLLHKFVLWVILDDSKKARKHARLLLPYQPKVISPDAAASPTSPPEELSIPELVMLPPSDLISELLETGDFADITFVVKMHTFAAHRCVLAARSSVFRSELLALQNDMSIKNLCVSIQHMDPLTFRYLLHFIYTDSLPLDFEKDTSPKKYHRMLVAAHRFKVEGLKLICEMKLTKEVSDTMITALDLSEHHECGLLRVVQPNCNMKQEIVASTALVTKEVDHLDDSRSCTMDECAAEESK
ncbi:hypothetical protein LUZ63_000189 [Rhynchospora breviuscula]|uniref:BTB domain-containing protein n=1 Tax=Rhynchospora breviuscula TaxID=2022672 RepID=A0A9Q0HWE6_9POAL|nr:hypothetical protein LUZ63_000189 [Rhynchospora breviuscula]